MPPPGETENVEFLRSSRRSPCSCRCCGQSPARYSTRQPCHTPQRAGLPSRCARHPPSPSVRRLPVSLRYSYFFSSYFMVSSKVCAKSSRVLTAADSPSRYSLNSHAIGSCTSTFELKTSPPQSGRNRKPRWYDARQSSTILSVPTRYLRSNHAAHIEPFG